MDTTSRRRGQGHPFGYFTQEMIEERDNEDVKQMVRGYDLDREFVVVMLMPDDP